MKEKCDFCSTVEIVWVYPAATFQVQGTPHYSAGDWDACHDCAALIEAGNREGLADRSMGGLPPPVRGNVRSRKMIRMLHDQFFAARTGPARRRWASPEVSTQHDRRVGTMDAKAIRERIGNTGCGECHGLGYAHFDAEDDPKILACDACTHREGKRTLDDDEALILHAAECGCGFLTKGTERAERDVAKKLFGAVPETRRISVSATMAFDVTACSDAEAKEIADEVIDRIWEAGIELPNADTEDQLVNATCYPTLDPVEIVDPEEGDRDTGRVARLKREAAGELYDTVAAIEAWLKEGNAPLHADSIIGPNDTDTLRAYVRTSLAVARGEVTRG